jgi:hypothetical protein
MHEIFKNTSIVRGIQEFKTDCGKEIRIIENKVYIFDKQHHAYIFDGTINNKKGSLKKIWNDYQERIYNIEIEKENERLFTV